MKDVVLKHIFKTYNKGIVRAVDDVSLEVEKGELFGLIGPDGAGKTSIFRILTTLLLPDSGSASVHGFDVKKDFREIRSRVGYMPGRFSLYQDLTVEENLSFFATVFNTSIQENYALIKDIYEHIEPFKKRRAGNLSGGMKQKLALCCALIHRPEVLFLDEPTTGVDAVSRKEFWGMLHRLRTEGITIMVSTPYMDEATLCERIALIQNGRIMSVETPDNIITAYPDQLYAIRSENMGALLHDLRRSPDVASHHSFGDHHHISFRAGDDEAAMQQRLLQYLREAGHQALSLQPIRPTIEDCFIQQMQG